MRWNQGTIYVHKIVVCPASVQSSPSYHVRFSLNCSLWFQTAYSLLPFECIKVCNKKEEMNSRRNKIISVSMATMSILEDSSVSTLCMPCSNLWHPLCSLMFISSPIIGLLANLSGHNNCLGNSINTILKTLFQRVWPDKSGTGPRKIFFNAPDKFSWLCLTNMVLDLHLTHPPSRLLFLVSVSSIFISHTWEAAQWEISSLFLFQCKRKVQLRQTLSHTRVKLINTSPVSWWRFWKGRVLRNRKVWVTQVQFEKEVGTTNGHRT